jgi:hypothetical protein
MELLTRDGRVRPICRECKKLHSRKDCPRRQERRYRRMTPETRRFCEWADAYQAWRRRQA